MTKNLSIKIAIFILMCSSVFHAQTSTGFVRLECGKMLDGNGQPFYPVICNYSMVYQFTACTDIVPPCEAGQAECACSSYVVSPASHYGLTIDFECVGEAPCLVQIGNDLDKIKSMGFNMIRPAFTVHWNSACGRIYMEGWGDANQNGKKVRIFMDPPYATNPDVIKYFQALEAVINLAASKGLKTMINGINNDLSSPAAATAYLEFLTALGNYFKDNKNLAFYDILSEPSFNYAYAAGSQDANTYNKSDACNLVASYYTTLKAADPNHLISGGQNGFDETKLFDPGVTKLDFTQPHFYGEYRPYDYSFVHYKERMLGHLWWYSKHCPVPWLLGEFGFRAIKDQTLIQYYEGSTSDQKDITDEMLYNSHFFGSLGFTWWEYQDQSWLLGENSYPQLPSGLNLPTGWGLLDFHGDISDNIPDEKPVVQSFQNYLDPITNLPPAIPVPPPGSTVTIGPQKPASYYDPYYTEMMNPNRINAVYGSVVDVNGNAIEDAVVTGLNWLYFDVQGPLPSQQKHRFSHLYTFTDQIGYFEIIPYNYIDPSDPRIVKVNGSAVGAEYFIRGQAGDVQLNPTIGNVVLEKVSLITGVEDINLKTVQLTQSEIYRAKENLFVRNTLIHGNGVSGGNVEMKARCEVAITEEFSAHYGSEVQIFNQEVYNECAEYSNFSNARQNSAVSSPSKEPSEKKTISIGFKARHDTRQIGLYPNPTNGVFTISAPGCTEKNKYSFTLYIGIGIKLREGILTSEVTTLDISDLSQSVYFLEIKSHESSWRKKIVLNK
jgi:hypothetical protein